MNEDKKTWIAYLLWIVGGLGCLGFHRLYLGKVPTGILWFFTGGMLFVGSLYDVATLPAQVERVNSTRALGRPGPTAAPALPKETLEQAILRTARQHQGRVTPALVASSSPFTLDEAQKGLDSLARRSHCELRVLASGTAVYRFPEFDPAADGRFEV